MITWLTAKSFRFARLKEMFVRRNPSICHCFILDAIHLLHVGAENLVGNLKLLIFLFSSPACTTINVMIMQEKLKMSVIGITRQFGTGFSFIASDR